MWPHSFTLVQRRSPGKTGNRSDATFTTFFDSKRGANLIKIVTDKNNSDVTWDLELNSGTSFYFNPNRNLCSKMHFPVGILRTNWLQNASLIGKAIVRGRAAVGWTKVDFIDYWADEETCEPLSWYFHGMDARFDSIYWGPNVQIPDTTWFKPPIMCVNSSL